MEDAVFVSEGSDWLALDRKLNTEQRNAGGVGDLASYVAQALSAGASSTHYCRARDKDLKRQERLPTCGKHRFLQSQVCQHPNSFVARSARAEAHCRRSKREPSNRRNWRQ